MTMLRKYCMGSRPCYLEFLSSEEEIFKDCFGTVNYQDPNMNISMPVFSIHGNHDDPSGDGNLCALDLLSVAGYINYFGKQKEVDDVKIVPILLRKGKIKVGLYGLGNIRDERLHRTFLKKKVQFLRPMEDSEDFFDIFVIHQNRVKHGATNYIPEHFLEDFIDLVIWGHEHECLIEPIENEAKGFHITQPGSSIATSLCEGESKAKEHKEFELEKIPLQSVRPFVMDEIILSKVPSLRLNDEKKIMKILSEKVESLIEQARQEWLETHSNQEDDFPKPIIRLKVEYTGFSTLNPQRFGQQFVDRVANVKDILQFFRKRSAVSGKSDNQISEKDIRLPENLNKLQMNDLISEYLSQFNMSILSEAGINEALRLFVEKEEKEAIADFVTSVVSAKTRVEKKIGGEDNLDLAIEKEVTNKRTSGQSCGYKATKKGASLKQSSSNMFKEVDLMDLTSPTKELKKAVAAAPKRGQKRKATEEAEEAKPASKARATRSTRSIKDMFSRMDKKNISPVDDDDDDEEESFSKFTSK
ncbi:Double-strand break repair protein mre11a [Dinochytrium kinnereticum]|nr:Double-strand break repair protein mre11a [Dinochytrium kinnereticum]